MITQAAKFEQPYDQEEGNTKLTGVIDCVDTGAVWEFKCVAELNETHILQLCLYKFLYETNTHNASNTRYRLFNVLDGETIEIVADYETIKKITMTLIKTKEDGSSVV
jgi:hypothetical protein